MRPAVLPSVRFHRVMRSTGGGGAEIDFPPWIVAGSGVAGLVFAVVAVGDAIDGILCGAIVVGGDLRRLAAAGEIGVAGKNFDFGEMKELALAREWRPARSGPSERLVAVVNVGGKAIEEEAPVGRTAGAACRVALVGQRFESEGGDWLFCGTVGDNVRV